MLILNEYFKKCQQAGTFSLLPSLNRFFKEFWWTYKQGQRTHWHSHCFSRKIKLCDHVVMRGSQLSHQKHWASCQTFAWSFTKPALHLLLLVFLCSCPQSDSAAQTTPSYSMNATSSWGGACLWDHLTFQSLKSCCQRSADDTVTHKWCQQREKKGKYCSSSHTMSKQSDPWQKDGHENRFQFYSGVSSEAKFKQTIWLKECVNFTFDGKMCRKRCTRFFYMME